MALADIAVKGAHVAYEDAVRRARALSGFRIRDKTFHWLTFGAAVAVLLILGGVIASLIHGSIPAFRAFGLGFLITNVWNPATDHYGALAAVYGTLVTSFIAMIIAVPVGLGVAIFLTELCPHRLRRPIGTAIELLAGIPSIIYGIWGLFVFAPFLQQYVQPGLIKTFANIPVLNTLFAGPPYGIGLLTAGFILAIMVLPFVSAVARDVFDTVPPLLKEAAYGIGCTTWEVVRFIVVPYTRVGVLGGVMLGLGRALGETMAVTFVIGNADVIPTSLLAPGTTISAAIANEFTEAVGDLYTSSLIELGLILFVITFIVLAISRLMLMRLEQAGALTWHFIALAGAPTRSGSAFVMPRSLSGSSCWRSFCFPCFGTALPACRCGLHAEYAAAGRGRRPSERDRRQSHHDHPGRRDRHAARHARRHLYGRIWAQYEAHHGGPLHQRYSAQRAVDRHRPLHLPGRW